MFVKRSFRKAVPFLFLIGFWLSTSSGLAVPQGGGVQAGRGFAAPQTGTTSYLPAITKRHPWLNPFGIEPSRSLLQGSTLLNQATALQTGWVRLNGRISWRLLQPTEGGPIQWSLLVQTENELRALNAAGLTPILIINDYPAWAVEIVRENGQPATCGPVRASKFLAFAQFMRAVVARFKTPEFNVHNWELGNEPDVDPDLVDPNSVYGCWGDMDDPFYGGRHYGEMLKVVTPAIRSVDSLARVWIGGLLLAEPFTQNPKYGRPELFLKGILEAGAAPFFDIVPYHWYPSYTKEKKDYDLYDGTAWSGKGGGTVGKATYIRELLQSYGVSKPLYLNETGLACPDDQTVFDWCVPPQGPEAQFFQVQADYLVRSFVRGLNAGISGFFWYTLDGPGWRFTGLLDEKQAPKPVYYSYKQLAAILQKAHQAGKVDYGQAIEAYAFRRGNQNIQIAWTIANTSLSIQVPEAKFVAAYSRDGANLVLTPNNGYYHVPVGFSPVYIIKLP